MHDANPLGPWLLLICLLGGCAHHQEPPPVVVAEPVEVLTPYAVTHTPPPELTGPIVSQVPEFVSPDDPRAFIALTPEGWTQLQLLIIELTGRLDEWEAWALPGIDEVAGDGRH